MHGSTASCPSYEWAYHLGVTCILDAFIDIGYNFVPKFVLKRFVYADLLGHTYERSASPTKDSGN